MMPDEQVFSPAGGPFFCLTIVLQMHVQHCKRVTKLLYPVKKDGDLDKKSEMLDGIDGA